MNFRYWLPQNALLGASAKDVLSGPVAEWSESWLGCGTATLADLRLYAGGGNATSLEIRGKRLRLVMSGPGKRRLLEAVLNADLSTEIPNECDSHLLDVLATEIAQDLVDRVEAHLEGDSREGEEPDVALTLAIGGSDMSELRLSSHTLVPALKTRLGGARPAAQQVHRLGSALRSTKVVAHATLGWADVTLGDMGELGVGDVLVLDRRLDELVELRVSAGSTPIGRGVLRRTGDQLSIQL